MSDAPTQFITLTEAGRRLGVSPRTLRQLVHRHRIEVYQDLCDARKKLLAVEDLAFLRKITKRGRLNARRPPRVNEEAAQTRTSEPKESLA